MKAKRIFSVLLAALMVLTLMPIMVMADGESGQASSGSPSGQSGTSDQSTESGTPSGTGGDDISVADARAINGIPCSDGGNVYLGSQLWRVIGSSSNNWLLISAKVLNGTCTWRDAKDYCNILFYDPSSSIFSDQEKAAIPATSKTEYLPKNG